jgi:hypothetical protein
MWRSIVAVVAGALTVALVVSAIESVAMALFPAPAGFDFEDPAQLARLMDVMPLPAKLLVLAAWVLGGLAGGFVAAFAAEKGSLRAPIAVGVIDVLLVIGNLVAFPHPLWMQVTGVLLPVPAAVLGGVLARRFSSWDPESRMPPG